jgi:DNA-binding MarR family transcriptional regulator
VVWRAFWESAMGLLDVLDGELQRDAGMPLRWYDVLVHLEEEPGGRCRMNQLAGLILLSKSGLTRLVDNLEGAGFVRRERDPVDRRAIDVLLTDEGSAALQAARAVHRRGIQQHFARHLDERDFKALERAFEKVRAAVRAPA